MNAPPSLHPLPPRAIIRWTARALSGLLLLVWGFFVMGHLLGDEGRPSRPLNQDDYVLLSMMAAWLAGLAIGWKWELAGGILTLAALSVAAVVNWHVLAFPGTLVALTAVLFLVSWWMGRRHSAVAAPV